jgi:hypothetical protein
MQSNTTGLSMEVFFTIMLTLSLICSLLMYNQLLHVCASQYVSEIHLKESKEKMGVLIEEYVVFHSKVESFLAKAEPLSQEPAHSSTPPKPNNWDSIREVFKAPVRVENE